MDERVKDDPWPFILMELDAAWREARATLEEAPRSGFVMQAEARYRNGEKLYEKEWLNWPLERFEDEAMQEIVDYVLYIAMRRVKFPIPMA